jgi:hypothetical protein
MLLFFGNESSFCRISPLSWMDRASTAVDIGGQPALRYLGFLTQRLEGSGDESEPACRRSIGVVAGLSSSDQAADRVVTGPAPKELRQEKR